MPMLFINAKIRFSNNIIPHMNTHLKKITSLCFTVKLNTRIYDIFSSGFWYIMISFKFLSTSTTKNL